MTQAPRVVNAVILDMDNTLYDWVGYFVPAVRAMLIESARLLDVNEKELRDDLRAVHIARGNTEYPFALLETHAVARCLPTMSVRDRHEMLKPAFAVFNELRRQRLRLYPDVFESLHIIKSRGCRLFGHTEASDINIASRARYLGLSDALEAIYAPQFIGPPHPLGDNRVRSDQHVPVRPLPSVARKPDPSAMNLILGEIGVEAQRCLYVGDSLTKDIAMAKRADMYAAWARYGTHHDPDLWRDLVELSHWDKMSVTAVEVAPDDSPEIEPDVILDSFKELLEHFDFSRP